MKVYKVIIMAVAAFFFTACGTTKSSSPYTVGTRLELSMNDLQFLGESEISCEYDTYFGIIRHLTKVNGEAYVPGNTTQLNLPASLLNFNNKGMRVAAAKLLQQYPEGTYFQVVMDTKNTDVSFLGSSTKRTVKVRVYKFK
jgi:hypothetical protein